MWLTHYDSSISVRWLDELLLGAAVCGQSLYLSKLQGVTSEVDLLWIEEL